MKKKQINYLIDKYWLLILIVINIFNMIIFLIFISIFLTELDCYFEQKIIRHEIN